MDTTHYAGEVKREICHRLVSDWQDLADHFDIPSHERTRFDRGREPQGCGSGWKPTVDSQSCPRD